MMRQHAALFVLAAILAVGALWAGASATTILLIVALLGCPVMMLLMMRSMGGQNGQDSEDSHSPQARPKHVERGRRS
jgi:uncharacterized membrane protein